MLRYLAEPLTTVVFCINMLSFIVRNTAELLDPMHVISAIQRSRRDVSAWRMWEEVLRTEREGGHEKSAHQGHRLNCDHCEKSYSAKTSLMRHMLLEHDVLVKCAECGKSFDEGPKRCQMKAAQMWNNVASEKYPKHLKIYDRSMGINLTYKKSIKDV